MHHELPRLCCFSSLIKHFISQWNKLILTVIQLVMKFQTSLDPKIHHRVHKSQPFDLIVIKFNPVHTLKPYFFDISLPCALSEHHAMKAYWGSGDLAPRLLWPWQYMEMSGQLHVPAAFPQGKSPWYPFDRRIGEPLPGLEPPQSSSP
jgi:hypothetical protein